MPAEKKNAESEDPGSLLARVPHEAHYLEAHYRKHAGHEIENESREYTEQQGLNKRRYAEPRDVARAKGFALQSPWWRFTEILRDARIAFSARFDCKRLQYIIVKGIVAMPRLYHLDHKIKIGAPGLA